MEEIIADDEMLAWNGKTELAAMSKDGMVPLILIVEDNTELLDYLSSIFADSLRINTAADGGAAWESIERCAPDLIISDVMMEPVDGLELCRRVKTNPKTAHIPLILLTARTATVQEMEGYDLGANDYVSKPFVPRLLQSKVAALLKNRHQIEHYHHRQTLLTPTELNLPSEERVLLERAMSIVEEHIDDPSFSVEVLVAEMNMSHSVFYRKMKEITGNSLVRFIRDVRLKRAAQLLRDSELRISEVAMRVGFDDPKYFGKAFAKCFGMPPSDYVRRG